MTELELLVDLHKNSDRQGPGSPEETLMALYFMDLPHDRELKVADIGCGSGSQTLALARHLNAQITAVDLFPEFLEELIGRAEKLGLDKSITVLQTSMDDLPFAQGEFDIIWSEGAVYVMGFAKGVENWKEFLKSGGYLALSEITWTTNSRPRELEEFWMREYPGIDTASNKIKILEDNGFTLAGYFILKQDSWIENYYKPLAARFEAFLARNENSDLARKVVEENLAEINLYEKYKNYYSYGFYIAKKTG